MNIDFNEEQEMLKKMAREFLTTKCPGVLVREMIEDERGYPPSLWKEISELGWVGLAFPSKYGGADGSFLDLSILLEEMGRACFPGPFFSTVVLAGMAILHGGTEEQKKELLSKLCKGELIATLALTEAEFNFDSSGVKMKAVAEGDSFILNGTKMFVTDAHIADLLICAARTNNGITVFLVDGKSPGIQTTLLKAVDGSKLCEVAFKNVKVPAKNMLGKLDKGWEIIDKILPLAAVARSAEMLGGAQRILELTIQYSNDRRQFGRLIGTFQAIQHHCANMAIDVDGMKMTTYQAAWMLSENLPSRKEVAIAKGWASDAFKRVALLGLKVHGGMGFMEDHDISIFYRKALTYENSFGDAEFHRKAIARELHMVS